MTEKPWQEEVGKVTDEAAEKTRNHKSIQRLSFCLSKAEQLITKANDIHRETKELTKQAKELTEKSDKLLDQAQEYLEEASTLEKKLKIDT